MKMNDLFYLFWKKTRTGNLLQVQKRNYKDFLAIIKDCNIDLFNQYTDNPDFSADNEYNKYYISKLENEHAFQARFTERSIKSLVGEGIIEKHKPLVLVDIGDSAGSHLKYQKKLLADLFDNIRAVSVNLDPVAVEKINNGGGEAVLCRAEEYRPEGMNVDLYLSYEMVEHLHNPAIFFHRLAQSGNGQFMVVTVPYRRRSRVAVDNSMNFVDTEDIVAENEHIFELCPSDWKKLAWHSGWKVRDEEIYYQYPRSSPLTPIFRRAWNCFDFEGFYAMFLERDMTAANRYKDWEE